MTLKEYIELLQKLEQEHGGDLPVIVCEGGRLDIWVGQAVPPAVIDFLPAYDAISETDKDVLLMAEKYVLI